MLDYYGLGPGFPSAPAPANMSTIERVERIEQAMNDDICNRVPELRPDIRFLPYVQLHEYEGLLFSGPKRLPAAYINRTSPPLFRRSETVSTPEDVDDGPSTAPSKRVIAAYPGYRKPLHGTMAATAVGIEQMRQECPHFRNWLDKLERLAGDSLITGI